MSEKKDEVNIFEEGSSGVKEATVYEGKSYHEDYDKFMETFRHQEVSGAEVGEMVARMAQHYTRHNIILARALKIYNQVARDVYGQTDESGKPLSAAKADVIASATPEAAAYQEAKVHVMNIEQDLNALKALQKGILNEHSYS